MTTLTERRVVTAAITSAGPLRTTCPIAMLKPRAVKNIPLPLLLFAATLAACGDSTAPPQPQPKLTVQLEVAQVSPPAYSTNENGEQFLRCDASLRATAVGDGDVTWRGGTFYFYAGKDRKTPQDSSIISANGAAAYFGGAPLQAGGTVTGGLSVNAGIPYSARVDLRYSHGSDEQTQVASTSFDCGPTGSSSATAPSIDVLTVAPASGTVRPGDTLQVHFEGHSDAGFWEYEVQLSGACVTYRFLAADRSTSVSQTVAVPVPPGCTDNSALTVLVSAVDVLQQWTTVNTSAPLTYQR